MNIEQLHQKDANNLNNPDWGMPSFLKKAGVIGVFLAAMGSSGEFKESQVEASAIETKTAEKLKVNEITLEEEIAKLDNGMMTDQEERMVVAIKRGVKWKFIESGGNNKSANAMPPQQVSELITGGADQVELIHTHPLASCPYSDSLKADIRSGKVKALPNPPSLDYDIMLASVTYAVHLGEQYQKIKSKVIDPTGVWEFTLDNKHPFVGKIKNYITDLEKGYLSAEEMALVKKEGIDLDKLNPQELLGALQNNPNTSKFADRLLANQQTASKAWISTITEKEMMGFDEAVYAAQNIINPLKDPKNISQRIEKFIAACKELGIIISYQPKK
ncbi:MAG: hypothetical protein WCK11_03595 [Candidatus Falkowbacteria bacterium]